MSNQYITAFEKIQIRYDGSTRILVFILLNGVTGDPHDPDTEITEYETLKLTLEDIISYDYVGGVWTTIADAIKDYVDEKLTEYLDLEHVDWRLACTDKEVNWVYGEDRGKVTGVIEYTFTKAALNALYSYPPYAGYHDEIAGIIPKFEALAEEIVGFINEKLS